MRFRNLDPRHRGPRRRDVFRWAVVDRLIGRRRRAPPGPPAPSKPPDLDRLQAPPASGQLTWIGHSSFLLQLGGANLLTDPVFSDRIGWFYSRHVPPGLMPEQLPRLDGILVSHNHYDHLDLPSIEALPREASVIAPRRLGPFFTGRLFSRVVELDWWESTVCGGATVTLVPARHWSRRSMRDFNRSLWGGFVVTGAEGSLYFAGDTAWCDVFTEIGRRFPALDAALLPIGGYEPAWFMRHNHLSPEEAGQAFLDCGARLLVPMHWGTFQMTDEPLLEPLERLEAWWRSSCRPAGCRLAVLAVGQTLPLRQ